MQSGGSILYPIVEYEIETQRISPSQTMEQGSEPLYRSEEIPSQLTFDSQLLERHQNMSNSEVAHSLIPSITFNTNTNLNHNSLTNDSQDFEDSSFGLNQPILNYENSSTENQSLFVSSSRLPTCQEYHVIDNFDYILAERSDPDRVSECVARSPPPDRQSSDSPIVSYRLCPLTMPAMRPPSAHARQVANRVIKHARDNKAPNEGALWCPHCRYIPVLPVTGQCGHTRCTKCIQLYGKCPCGCQAPESLHVNTLVQNLIEKIVCNASEARSSLSFPGILTQKQLPDTPVNSIVSSVSQRLVKRRCIRLHHGRSLNISGQLLPEACFIPPDISPRMPMSTQARYDHACELLSTGRYRQAVPHFARVAATSESLSRSARILLAQTIVLLSQGRDPRRLMRELFRSVRLQSAASWLKPQDLECVLCYHTFTRPVTTPCGHTYCRTCIERSMDYRKTCALCQRSLEDFDLSATHETTFVSAALASIDALNPPVPPEPDVIPIFVCTVAFPAIPCPLFIFDPRYWLMIRRVLESGSRKFGMVAYERDRSYSDYGTVLEVRDCVHLEDGRSILSTVGVSRFKVIERDVRDGCDVARIQPLVDITPTEEVAVWDLRIMATQISYKALLWLNTMSRTVRSEIEAAFGQLPFNEHRDENWWHTPDGPAWLWWLIAILPLRSEIKILTLATNSLRKRMMAVSRTLEVIDQLAISTTNTSDCELLTNDEEWLDRGTRHFQQL